jgi:hypothetical protein
MMMIDIAMIVSGMLYFWDANREEVEIYSIWKDELKANHGFVDLYFTETPL